MRVRGANVVITGASSGIGRAAALAFARSGASLALAARSKARLERAAEECERLGARAVTVPTDTSDPESVEALGRAAVEALGSIDVWVNNAAVLAAGKLEDVPVEVSRRVIEVNVLGYMYGARVAITRFRERRRGVLVNVSSLLGSAAAPLMPTYVASKFAIQGLAASLRQDLVDMPEIHVCNVLPGPVGTELFGHVANYTGRAVKPPPPVYNAETVARAIAGCVERPRRNVVVGRGAELLRLGYRLAPPVAERLAPMLSGFAFSSEPVGPTTGILFEPSGD